MFHFSFLPSLLLLLNFLPINTSSKADKSEKILISGYASIHTTRCNHPGQLPDMNLPYIVSRNPTGSREENHKSPKRARSCPSGVSMESVLARESHKPLKRKAESSLPLGGYNTATTRSSFPSFGSISKSYGEMSALRANKSKIERHKNLIKYTNPYLDNTYPSFHSTSNSYWPLSASRANNSKIEGHNNQIKYTRPYLHNNYPSFRSTSNSYWARHVSGGNNSKVEKHNEQIKHTEPYLDQLEKQHSFPSFSLSNSYRAQIASRTNNIEVERYNEQIKYTRPYHHQLEKKHSSPSFGSALNSERTRIEETSGRQELDLTLRL